MIAAVSVQPSTASPLLPAPASPGFAGLLADHAPATAAAPKAIDGNRAEFAPSSDEDDDELTLPLIGVVPAAVILPPAAPPAATADPAIPIGASPSQPGPPASFRSDPVAPRPLAEDTTVEATEQPPLAPGNDHAATQRPDRPTGGRRDTGELPAQPTAPVDPGVDRGDTRPTSGTRPEVPPAPSPSPNAPVASMGGPPRRIVVTPPATTAPPATTSQVGTIPSAEIAVAVPTARSRTSVAPLVVDAADNGRNDRTSSGARGDRRDDVARPASPAAASIPDGAGSDRPLVAPTSIEPTAFYSATPPTAASSARAARNEAPQGRAEPGHAPDFTTDVSVTTPALGEVSAAVTARAGATDRLNVHFAVERESTATLIAHGDGLDRALAMAGATLETVSIEVRGERTSGGATDLRDAQSHARDASADARQSPPSRAPHRPRAAVVASPTAPRRDRFA